MKTLGWDFAWQAREVELLNMAKVLRRMESGEVGLSPKIWPRLMGVKHSQERPIVILRYICACIYTKIYIYML